MNLNKGLVKFGGVMGNDLYGNGKVRETLMYFEIMVEHKKGIPHGTHILVENAIILLAWVNSIIQGLMVIRR